MAKQNTRMIGKRKPGRIISRYNTKK